MGSQVTFSGFNQIDFNTILNSVMAQERAPLTTLQTQQKGLTSQSATYRTLASQLAAFQSAVDALATGTAASTRAVSNTDSGTVKAVATAGGVSGSYDVVVDTLARAQVTAATSTAPDANATIVAQGGQLIFSDTVSVTIDGPVTLQGLADTINAVDGIPARASVIRASATSWQLVLTSKSTGLAGRFEFTSTLHGAPIEGTEDFAPSGVLFATDEDGVTGRAGNAVGASDAKVFVNNIAVTSSTNTVADAIPGVTLTLNKTSAPDTRATITLADDVSGTRGKLEKVADAYNQLVKFADAQRLSAISGDAASIGRDPLLRGLLATIRQQLTGEYPSGGSLKTLTAVGLVFDRAGKLSVTAKTFDDAAGKDPAALQNLFAASGAQKGVFTVLQQVVKSYTAPDGLLRGVQDRLTAQGSALDRRIAQLEARLDVRRETLQKEYMAADLTMTQLNASTSSLSSLSNQYRLF